MLVQRMRNSQQIVISVSLIGVKNFCNCDRFDLNILKKKNKLSLIIKLYDITQNVKYILTFIYF